MWISRDKWREMNAKIERLESQQKLYFGYQNAINQNAFPQLATLAGLAGMNATPALTEMSLRDVVSEIVAHLGMVVTPGTSRQVTFKESR